MIKPGETFYRVVEPTRQEAPRPGAASEENPPEPRR
jgi:hypothetical protein